MKRQDTFFAFRKLYNSDFVWLADYALRNSQCSRRCLAPKFDPFTAYVEELRLASAFAGLKDPVCRCLMQNSRPSQWQFPHVAVNVRKSNGSYDTFQALLMINGSQDNFCKTSLYSSLNITKRSASISELWHERHSDPKRSFESQADNMNWAYVELKFPSVNHHLAFRSGCRDSVLVQTESCDLHRMLKETPFP